MRLLLVSQFILAPFRWAHVSCEAHAPCPGPRLSHRPQHPTPSAPAPHRPAPPRAAQPGAMGPLDQPAAPGRAARPQQAPAGTWPRPAASTRGAANTWPTVAWRCAALGVAADGSLEALTAAARG